jgi:hypothetical protein
MRGLRPSALRYKKEEALDLEGIEPSEAGLSPSSVHQNQTLVEMTNQVSPSRRAFGLSGFFLPVRLGVAAVGILAVLGFTGAAQAGHPVREAKPRVIETTHLMATDEVESWESKPLTTKQILYVHVYRRGREIKQRFVTGCGAGYRSGGLVVRMRVRGCAKGRWSIALRYVSLARPQRFKVRITTNACDRVPGARGGCY